MEATRSFGVSRGVEFWILAKRGVLVVVASNARHDSGVIGYRRGLGFVALFDDAGIETRHKT